MRDDKIIIISHYHFLCTILFLCKSEPGNLISFWTRHDLFCFISSKRNLILSHLIKKESDSVSSHKIRIQFCLISWKMNLILSHLTEKKSDSVSSHQKKILFCLISSKKNLILSHLTEKNSYLILILTQNRIRSEQEILILAISLIDFHLL